MAELVKFRVIGIGEFGKNAINKMKDSDLKGVEYSVIDDNSNPNILKANIVTALPVSTDMVFVVVNIEEEINMNIDKYENSLTIKQYLEKYIHYYNEQRIHTAIGMSPDQKEGQKNYLLNK